MKQISLDQLIRQYWQKKTLSKWDVLFKKWDADFNLYLVNSGKIIIQKDEFDIFVLSEWQVIWEKSFITKTKKPLDAKALEDSEIYFLSNEKFETFETEFKNNLLTHLVVFLSERVNKLDTILAFLSILNDDLVNYDINHNAPILSLVNHLVDLHSFLILKNEKDSYYKVFGDIELDQVLFDFINDLIEKDTTIKIWKNYVYLNWWEYIYLFNWVLKIEEYILHNLFYYARSMLNYFGEKLESYKNYDLEKNITSSNE